MAKSRTNPGFDAHKFIDEVNREQERVMKACSAIPEGAIPSNPWDAPPAPNMYHDHGLWMWVPDTPKKVDKELEWNPDIRRRGYSITGKKLPGDAELTNQSGNRDPDQSP